MLAGAAPESKFQLKHVPPGAVKSRATKIGRAWPPRLQGVVMGLAGAGNIGTVLEVLIASRIAAAQAGARGVWLYADSFYTNVSPNEQHREYIH
jgi:hypothetical protein